jgi:exopolysaccharide biosynthesis polyprenyl glycosylphosphotransferase
VSSAPYFNPAQKRLRGPELAARLIPGSACGSRRPQEATGVLRDYLLVVLNWVLVTEIWLRLHGAFPRMSTVSGLSLTSSLSPTLAAIAILHAILIQLVSGSSGLRSAERDVRKQMRMVGWAVFWSTVVLSAALQLRGLSATAASLVFSAGVLHFVTLFGRRWAEREGRLCCVQAMQGTRNVLIVGSGQMGRRIANYLDHHPEMNRSVCGFLDDRKPLGDRVVGRTSDLAELGRSGFVDEVILAAPHDRDVTLRVVHSARKLHLDVKMAPDLFGCEPAGESQRVGGIPLIPLHEEELPVRGLVAKRVLDVAAAAAVLTFLAPALALIAILIKLGSPGPVLYSAPRAGHKGKPFQCYKFRTMVKDADDLKETLRKRNQRSGPFFKIACDPRVTRVGRFLRRYSLDELPQLLNVLKGEMSLVGPRPHTLDDVSAYTIEHLPRLDVIPGMTGLWQVTARRDPSFQTGMNLDKEYIRHWSLGMDMRILLKTAGAVLRGSGD